MSELVLVSSGHRIEAIDVAKGLGIVLVVFGHNGYFLQNFPQIIRAIYLFHVPLFFFLAGSLVKPGRSIAVSTQSRFHSVLKPYAIVCVVLGIWAHRSMAFTFQEYFLGVLYGTGETLLWVPMWFLPALFGVVSALQLGVNLFDRYFSRLQWLVFGLILLVGGFILLQAILGCGTNLGFFHRAADCHRTFTRGWWWSADLLPINLGFAVAGFALKDTFGKFSFRLSHLMGASIFFIFLSECGEARLDLNMRIVDAFLPAMLAAVVGIFCVVSLASMVQGLVIAKVLSYCGAASLIVLIFHSRIQGKLLNLFEDLGVLNGLSAFFALVTSIAFGVLVHYLARRFKPLGWFLLPARKSS